MRPLRHLLTNPWLDKAVAFVVAAPFAYQLATDYPSFRFEIPWLGYFSSNVLIVSLLVFRRTPSRVTPNPWLWLLALVATAWGFLPLFWEQEGRPLAPPVLLDAITLLGCGLEAWGRLSLGRNIGLVPAQRELVAHGAYRFMRHPIYTGAAISGVGYALAYYSTRNALYILVLLLWFVVRSFMEESYLRGDPAYAAYMARVRCRWLPGLA